MNLPDGYFLQDGKYRLARTIGQGGFGITYLGVWNTEVKGELGAMKTQVPVCIKEYFFKDYCYRDKDTNVVAVHSETGKTLFDKFKEKLIKEANILSAVHHPNIVNVLEVFEENNTAYIVMEYIEGCSLKYMLEREGVLQENKLLKYTHQIGNALDFVHEKNIVHLDIKPSNILIDREDNARLIDFGVSKRYDMNTPETSTTTLTLSKGFASIEQYDDDAMQTFSPCPDIYSLGATMYNLLTGVIPVESILRAAKPMLPPSAYNSNVTKKTEKAILKAMEIKPEDRFQTMKEMLAAIDIPPYELAENLLVETPQPSVEDSTEIINSGTNEEDCTVIAQSPSEEASLISHHKHHRRRKNKKKARGAIVISTILFIGAVCWALFNYTDVFSTGKYSAFGNMSDSTRLITPDDFNIAMTEKNESLGSVNNADIQENTVKEPVSKEEITLKPENKTEIKPEKASKETPTAQKPSHESTTQEAWAIPDNSANDAKIEESCLKYISSAKMKMENKHYAEAQKDLMEAAKLKTTDEVINLISICKTKQEEQATAEKAKQYTSYNVDFGSLKIVKKNGYFGAVNSKYEEIIPCQYVDMDKAANGRAFLRKDGRYDIYDNSGKVIAKGQMEYR